MTRHNSHPRPDLAGGTLDVPNTYDFQPPTSDPSMALIYSTAPSAHDQISPLRCRFGRDEE